MSADHVPVSVPIDNAPIPTTTLAQARNAAYTVACHANDAADARMILCALGLLEHGRIVAPQAHVVVAANLGLRPVVG